ncbi:hypothetical protein ARMGADRAFT_1115106 [Armillaria gallica]|uniref:Uncharacterized protein n=1 Tax=Armillaria gallica TaxID=47427 RepID=A0A2H3D126_ARMGA|nr:hypothetical protein ARMGADRAFT_1115106 [Armillaria gallica]
MVPNLFATRRVPCGNAAYPNKWHYLDIKPSGTGTMVKANFVGPTERFCGDDARIWAMQGSNGVVIVILAQIEGNHNIGATHRYRIEKDRRCSNDRHQSPPQAVDGVYSTYDKPPSGDLPVINARTFNRSYDRGELRRIVMVLDLKTATMPHFVQRNVGDPFYGPLSHNRSEWEGTVIGGSRMEPLYESGNGDRGPGFHRLQKF